MKYLENQRIPVSEILDKKCYLNITSCFASPLQELSGDGNLLLDFLTHTLDFTKNSTVEYQDGVMKLLGSDYCSTRDASGQVLLEADNVVFVIRRTQPSGHFKSRPRVSFSASSKSYFPSKMEVYFKNSLKPLDTFGKQCCPRPTLHVPQLIFFLYKITTCENLGSIGHRSREKITGKPTLVSARFAVS